jgi:hypothetical protein
VPVQAESLTTPGNWPRLGRSWGFLDRQGRLIRLDLRETTVKTIAEVTTRLDFEAVARDFARRDSAK